METIRAINPIIKICEKCNFGCSYCYYSTFNHDPKRKSMSEKMALEIVRQAAMYNKTFGDNYINICWHGGEPLLYGAERFEKLLEGVTQLLNEIKIDFSYSLQTNGYLIDKVWADIFKKYGVMIGVSIDGTEEINDSQRGFDGKPVTRTILDNIQYIRENGMFSGILSVITSMHKGKAKEVYDFFVKNNIGPVGLCKCYVSGEAVDEKALSDFLIELFDIWFYGKEKIDIREFSVAISNYLDVRHPTCSCRGRILCGSFMTFTTNGDVFFCDNFDDYDCIGNINSSSLTEIVEGEKFQEKRRRVLDWYNEMCGNCVVKNLCKGSCSRQDIMANGKKTNAFCNVNRRFFLHVKKILDEAVPEVDKL